MLERTWTNYHIKINSFHLDIEWKIGKIQSIMLIDIQNKHNLDNGLCSFR